MIKDVIFLNILPHRNKLNTLKLNESPVYLPIEIWMQIFDFLPLESTIEYQKVFHLPKSYQWTRLKQCMEQKIEKIPKIIQCSGSFKVTLDFVKSKTTKSLYIMNYHGQDRRQMWEITYGRRTMTDFGPDIIKKSWWTFCNAEDEQELRSRIYQNPAYYYRQLPELYESVWSFR